MISVDLLPRFTLLFMASFARKGDNDPQHGLSHWAMFDQSGQRSDQLSARMASAQRPMPVRNRFVLTQLKTP